MNSNNIFDQIRSQANIVEVIEKRISLKKQGGEWVGLCPFHDDHNPSMFVSSRKQLYKCFSCGAGGDVFKFIMEYDKVPVKEALKSLADLYKITLPDTYSFQQAEKIDRYLDMKNLNAWAADIYHGYLFQAKGGEPGRIYLKTRGLSRVAMDAFKIGYAPNSDPGIIMGQIRSKKKGGLSWKKSSLFVSGYWGERDFFRHRVIFPIHNEKGEVLGFGGRTVENENPKYLNVRESPWFRKREILYGIKESYARIIKGKQVYVVEGYLDVVAGYEAGIAVVAPLGTALTREHLLKLRRYADKVNLLFDGDEAGHKAAWRSAQDMAALAMDGEVFILPAGVDPFDFFKTRSSDEVREFLSQGVNIYRYLVEEVSQNKGKWSPVEKKLALDKLIPVYTAITDTMVKKNFGDMIGDTFSLGWEKYLEERPMPQSPARRQPVTPKTPAGPLIKKERTFVVFLCDYPDYISSAQPVLQPDNFEDSLSRYIYRKLLTLKKGISFQNILNAFREDGQEKVADFIEEQCLKRDYLRNQLKEREKEEERNKTKSVSRADQLDTSKKPNDRTHQKAGPSFIKKWKEKEKNSVNPDLQKEIDDAIRNEFGNRLVRLKQESIKKKKTQISDQLKSISQEEGDEGEKTRDLRENYTALTLEEDNLKNFIGGKQFK